MIYAEDFMELKAKVMRLERRQELIFRALEKIIKILTGWKK